MKPDKDDRAETRSFWEKHASITIVVVLLILLGLVITIGP